MEINFRNPGHKAISAKKLTAKKLSEATQRLNSGERINSAADDAAGLAVSEKLRSIDRGLRQGMRNVSDGLNYIDTVDGCTQQINDILHRLKELAVESANGPYSNMDRNALDLEYQQYLDEINQMTDTSLFNTIPLFDKHQPVYTFMPGNIVHNGPVTIDSSNDLLVIDYSLNDIPQTISVNIEHGTFSADEIADKIDDFLYDKAPSLIIGVNEDNQFTLQAENGHIDSISGSGATLFYDLRLGSSSGYLMGMTKFKTDDPTSSLDMLEVVKGQNDEIKFHFGNADDTSMYTLKLTPNSYSRPDLVKEINKQIAANGLGGKMEARLDIDHEGGKIIALWGEKPIKGLKGNFLKIDDNSSPIFDICNHSTLDNTNGTLVGKAVLSGDNLKITRGINDYFNLEVGFYKGSEFFHNKVDDTGNVTKNSESRMVHFDLLGDQRDTGTKIYSSAAELAKTIQDTLNESLKDVFTPDKVPIKVRADGNTLYFETTQYGDKSFVKLDRSNVPSAHMVFSFFDAGTLKGITPRPSYSSFTPAALYSNQSLYGGVTIDNTNNELTFNISIHPDDGTPYSNDTLSFKLDKTFYSNAAAVADELNSKLPDKYKGVFEFSSNNNKLALKCTDPKSTQIYSISAVESCSAYTMIIKGSQFFDNIRATGGNQMSLVEKTDKAPNSQSPNIISTPGRTNAPSYNNGNISHKDYDEGKYKDYSKVELKYESGTNGKGYNDYVGLGKDATPATMTINGVKTQFFGTNNTCTEDLSLSFKLTDSFGNPQGYSITFKKGTSFDQCISQISANFGSELTVSANGNNLVFTSKDVGGHIKFSEATGTFLRSAKDSEFIQKNSPVIINKDENTAHTNPSVTLNDAGTNFTGNGFSVDSFNDTLTIAAGEKTATVKIPHTPPNYTSLQEFVNKINPLLSGSGFTASTNGTYLKFSGDDDIHDQINFYGNTGLDKKKTGTATTTIPATLTVAGVSTNLPITVNNSNNKITMKYRSPSGGTEDIEIIVPNGSYSNITSLVSRINSDTRNTNVKGKITIAIDGNGIKFTTSGKGDGYVLSDFGGSFGNNVKQTVVTNHPSNETDKDESLNLVYTAGLIENNQYNTLFSNGGLKINDNNNKLRFTVNSTRGTNKTFEITIPNGTYTNSNDIITIINNALRSYNDGTGSHDYTTDTVKAVITGNTLQLKTQGKTSGTGTTISLASGNTSPLFMRKVNADPPDRYNRDESRCKITGTQVIKGPIEIGSWNDTMTFDYTSDNGSLNHVSITLNDRDYSGIDDILNALQEKIDEEIGKNQLKVKIVGNCLQLESARISSKRRIGNFKGELFKKIFQGASYIGLDRCDVTPGSTEGTSFTYIFGNNPIEPQTADEIEEGKNLNVQLGVNDTFKFDFTYNGEHTIEVQIPEGFYTNDEIAAELQTLIRNQIAEMGLLDYDGDPIDPERFNVAIGLKSLNIPNNDLIKMDTDDKLVLAFKEYEDGTVRKSDALIDGIRGSAAYRVFYETTKTPQPAICIGGADLTNGVEIQYGVNNLLGFTLDGVSTMVSIPSGYYTANDLSEHLSKQLENIGSIVRTHITKDGYLMLYTLDDGDYNLEKVRGSGANDLFYGGSARDDDEEGPGIHYGRRTDSYIWMKKSRIDAHLMRINTTGVNTMERAAKAINRLDYANDYLLKYRAQHGAYENRIERTYNRLTVQSENLQKSESSIRDTDIPLEIAQLNKQSIVSQVQDFMLKQEQELAQSSMSTFLNQKG